MGLATYKQALANAKKEDKELILKIKEKIKGLGKKIDGE
jgi:hypothetical protein